MQVTGFKGMHLAELQKMAGVEDQPAESVLQMSEMVSHPLVHREDTPARKER